MVEIQEGGVQQMRIQKLSLQTRAYEVSLKAAEAGRLTDPELRNGFTVRHPGGIKESDSLGDPYYPAIFLRDFRLLNGRQGGQKPLLSRF